MTNEYKEGYKAWPSKKCPYHKNTSEYRRWWKGWYDCNNDLTRLSEDSAMFS